MNPLPRLAVLAAAASLCAAGAAPPSAGAGPPSAAPGFAAPLAFTNPLVPFQPGGFKVYAGTEGGRRLTQIEHHLVETRTFSWQGGVVNCRVLREVVFKDGACAEISREYLAQGDDGGVYTFGEVSEPVPPPPEDPEDEPGDTESGDWVVGAVGPGDPPGTTGGGAPSLFMPAAPRPGDTWKPEDFLPVVDESDLAVREGLRIRVPAGIFHGCLEVLETSVLDPMTETKWYAPGVGCVRGRSREGTLRLAASTMRRR